MSETTAVKRKCANCLGEFKPAQSGYFGGGEHPYCYDCYQRLFMGIDPLDRPSKPSLGLTPRGIWLSLRRGDVLRAIRGKAASATSPDDSKLIGEWACELLWIEEQIKNNEAMNGRKP